MPSTTEQNNRSVTGESKSREQLELERRYGSIGIPAVAAAAQYHDSKRGRQSATSTPTHAHRFEDPTL